MYSLILMSALTAAPDGPEFNGLFSRLFRGGDDTSASASAGCHGSGCYGSGSQKSSGCTGSCSGSCTGANHDTGFGHRLRAFCHKSKGSSGCYGSGSQKSSGCTGSVMKAGCCGGSGYGCSGSYAMGCTGSGIPLYAEPLGGYGPPPPIPAEGFAVPSPATSYAGPVYVGGCTGGGIPIGPSAPIYGTPPMGTVPAPMPVPNPPLPTSPGIPPANDAPQAVPRPASPPPPPTVEENRGSTTGYARATAGDGRATVTVRLPADAVLFADGRRLNLSTAERTFVTPPLPPGPGFVYEFRAEYIRNGETISQSRRVPVRAGGTAAVEFTDLTARASAAPEYPVTRTEVAARPTSFEAPKLPVAQPAPAARTGGQPARLTVRVPAGATLFVDGRKTASDAGVREFTTPPIPVGQEFSYVFKAERVRNGHPETQTQQVTFRSGELVTVDFANWATN